MEIGCNDGMFASNFDRKKITCVEPCKDVALEARKKGLNVYIDYFDDKLVKKITKSHKKV